MVSNFWLKLNNIFSANTKFLVPCAFLIPALTLNGNWLTIWVHLTRQFEPQGSIRTTEETVETFLESWHLKDLPRFWISCTLFGYGIYFVFGIGLHVYYYMLQKDKAEQWKCQPHHWLPQKLELEEIEDSIVTLFLANTISSLVACHIYNGGYSTMYYKWNEYGALWWLLSFPVIFSYMDYSAYWLHRMFHFPYWYKRFHKIHHKYQQPTAFSVVAFHPLEVILIQLTSIAPIFVVPVHWIVYEILVFNGYYHGILTHSGIKFDRQWWQPWQLTAAFHDDHHKYCHVNFGFNCEIWDKIHGTSRQTNRFYDETTYYGHGKAIDDEKRAQELKTE